MSETEDFQRRSIAVIGLGMAATPHANSLLDLHNRVTVKAVYSRTEKTRNEFSEKYGFHPVSCVPDILNDESISAV